MSSRQRIAILGDIHYEPSMAAIYRRAMYQILQQQPSQLFALGDVGGYSYAGSKQSFEDAFHYLSDFGIPFHPLIGNHDLEALEFASDQSAIDAWCCSFAKPRPYYSVKLPGALGIVLSATQFREAPNCCHEVRLDPAQIQWFKETLAAHPSTPTFVFSHVPIAGSRLRVIQNIHLRAPNAYLNHSDNPLQFMDLLADNPQVKLWFSAHNHLGHNYSDAITTVDTCTFVHTGTMGPVSRDETFHSRFLDFDSNGFTISTFDHLSSSLREDFSYSYAENSYRLLSEFDQPAEKEYLGAPPFERCDESLRIGRSAFLRRAGMIVEYDAITRSAMGIVDEGVGRAELTVGADTLLAHCQDGSLRSYSAKEDGWFFKVFFKNNWLEKLDEARRAQLEPQSANDDNDDQQPL